MIRPQKFKEILSTVKLPFYEGKIQAGFPSPADDYSEKVLDLNEHLIKHPASTFYIRASCDAMIGAGIYPNDLLIVDRSLHVKNNDVVLAILNGEFVLRKYIQRPGQLWLRPENPCYPNIRIEEGFDFEVWGVVAHAVHHLV